MRRHEPARLLAAQCEHGGPLIDASQRTRRLWQRWHASLLRFLLGVVVVDSPDMLAAVVFWPCGDILTPELDKFEFCVVCWCLFRVLSAHESLPVTKYVGRRNIFGSVCTWQLLTGALGGENGKTG